jgi:hypothetical protein
MGPEGAEADAPEAEEASSEDVTITLSKDLAQQLHDVLMGVLASDEESGEAEELEDLGIDLSDEESGDEELNDSTEMSELPDATAKMQSKNNKVAGVAGKASGGKADSKATDDQGNEYHGHPMDKESPLTSTSSGSNKVSSTKTNKPGGHLFA